MNSLHSFVAPTAANADDAELVNEASSALDRFTDAFNACDLDGMDHALHFPHVMYSAAELLVWESPGQHPHDFFVKLKATGWCKTQYERKEVVLVARDKVHFVVAYTRRDANQQVLSAHTNLWVVTRQLGRCAIALRSY